ncbi:MAG: zinc ribbon domain-containing protein [Desulfobulbaceae bacterium]|uniref:Zinc ribbon domain-containing protein n=1 Tax=Candidatus Desulfobia pelagia TaxID=2841692 RepID=A0A8J6NAT2_9BACT|nr:zinc ribbon domain-containing protein [Candidatus Desulfobia pelagia]
MPIYEYEHTGDGCRLGKSFEWTQSMSSEKFNICPECDEPVKRLVSLFSVSTPKTNSDLKNLGFTKLVKRDDGVYENVTATGKESKIWDAGKPETLPDLKSKIGD